MASESPWADQTAMLADAGVSRPMFIGSDLTALLSCRTRKRYANDSLGLALGNTA